MLSNVKTYNIFIYLFSFLFSIVILFPFKSFALSNLNSVVTDSTVELSWDEGCYNDLHVMIRTPGDTPITGPGYYEFTMYYEDAYHRTFSCGIPSQQSNYYNCDMNQMTLYNVPPGNYEWQLVCGWHEPWVGDWVDEVSNTELFTVIDTAPKISIMSPQPPLTVNKTDEITLNIEAEATKGIKGIGWYLGTEIQKYTDYTLTTQWTYYQQDSFTTSFDTTGKYYLHAYVFDREDPQREDLVTWEINVQNSPPTIIKTSPVPELSTHIGKTITFSAEATAGSGIKGIEWFVSTFPQKYTDFSSTSNFTYYQQDSWSASFDHPGTYYIHAYVYDRETSQREAFTTWQLRVRPDLKPGDLNFDGQVTTYDVIAGLRSLVGYTTTPIVNKSGDTNLNFKIDLGDISYILKKVSSEQEYFYEDFDGLDSLSNWTRREVMPPSNPEGPDLNYWDPDNVTHDSSLGIATLKSDIRGTQRISSELTYEEKQFPIVGTFAARVRYRGVIPQTDQTAKHHQSVRAFFTYTSDPAPYPHCAHVENDFEVITEPKHFWQTEGVEYPQMTVNTHVHNYDFESQNDDIPCNPIYLKNNGEAKSSVRPLIFRETADEYRSQSVFSDYDQFITLIVRVSKIEEDDTYMTLMSEYYSIDSKGTEQFYGTSVSKHYPWVKKVKFKFNNWWLDPTVEEYYGSSVDLTKLIYHGPQYLDIDWIYYNYDWSLPVIEAHNRGELLNNH